MDDSKIRSFELFSKKSTFLFKCFSPLFVLVFIAVGLFSKYYFFNFGCFFEQWLAIVLTAITEIPPNLILVLIP